jgi:hypothetical protein
MICGLVIIVLDLILLGVLKEGWFGAQKYIFYGVLTLSVMIGIVASFTIAAYCQCLIFYNKKGGELQEIHRQEPRDKATKA